MVYKWTDKDGVVHFSDQPVPGAEKIVTSSGAPTDTLVAAAEAETPVPQPQSKPRNATNQAILVLAIDSPAREQVFFNDDVVSVRLHVEPGLQRNQTVTWNLNGQPLDQEPRALSFALPTLPRGTYVIGATVSDSTTGVSQTADNVTFYVRQPSELAPQHKKS